MNLLLDTHTLIWWTIDTNRLSEQVASLLKDEDNTLFLSIASIWEMQIKLQIGKLTLRLQLPELIESQRQTNDLQILAIKLDHIYSLANLPSHHRDPFDRLLVAQAMFEKMPLLSIDSALDGYPIQRLW